MKTAWCIKAHDTSPAVIDKLLPWFDKGYTYSSSMSVICTSPPVSTLWDIFCTLKTHPTDWHFNCIDLADNVCFDYAASNYDPTIIFAVIDMAVEAAQTYLREQVDCPMFGVLPMLHRPMVNTFIESRRPAGPKQIKNATVVVNNTIPIIPRKQEAKKR